MGLNFLSNIVITSILTRLIKSHYDYTTLLTLNEEVNPSVHVIRPDHHDVNKELEIAIKETMKISFELKMNTWFDSNARSIFTISTKHGNTPRLPRVWASTGSGLYFEMYGGSGNQIGYGTKVGNNYNMDLNKFYKFEIYYSATLSLYIISRDNKILFYSNKINLSGVSKTAKYYFTIDDYNMHPANCIIRKIKVQGCTNCDIVRNNLIQSIITTEIDKKQIESRLTTKETQLIQCNTNINSENNNLNTKNIQLQECERVLSLIKPKLINYQPKSAKKNNINENNLLLLNINSNNIIFIGIIIISIILNIFTCGIIFNNKNKLNKNKNILYSKINLESTSTSDPGV